MRWYDDRWCPCWCFSTKKFRPLVLPVSVYCYKVWPTIQQTLKNYQIGRKLRYEGLLKSQSLFNILCEALVTRVQWHTTKCTSSRSSTHNRHPIQWFQSRPCQICIQVCVTLLRFVFLMLQKVRMILGCTLTSEFDSDLSSSWRFFSLLHFANFASLFSKSLWTGFSLEEKVE